VPAVYLPCEAQAACQVERHVLKHLSGARRCTQRIFWPNAEEALAVFEMLGCGKGHSGVGMDLTNLAESQAHANLQIHCQRTSAPLQKYVHGDILSKKKTGTHTQTLIVAH